MAKLAWLTRSRVVLLVAAIVAAAGIIGGSVIGSASRQTSEIQAEQLADPLSRICMTDPEAAVRAGANCGQASQVARDGAGVGGGRTSPVAGADGDDGRGIVATALQDGRLIITYTDGDTVDVGEVAGEAGEPGAPGDPGEAGQDGADGTDGQPGRGISSTAIIAGRLVVTYSDGNAADLGRVVGATGAPGTDGTDGADGRGLASVAAKDGRLLITYTDGATQDAGPLPRGQRGPPGPTCPDGYEAVTGSVVVSGQTVRAVVCVDPSTVGGDTGQGATPDDTPENGGTP